jgi:hypothetical protein
LIYCQNAHTVAQEVTVELFAAGSTTPDATLKQTLEPGQTAKWNVKTDATTWTSDKQKFGYAKFSGATGNVACVVDGQNSVFKWNSAYSAVSTAYSANKLTVPLVYNKHGYAQVLGKNGGQSDRRASFVNTGFAVVNAGANNTTAKVTFTASNSDDRPSYKVVCTQELTPGQSRNWYIPLVWESGGFEGQKWACTETYRKVGESSDTINTNFPLYYEYGYNSFGTVVVEGESLLGVVNHNQQDDVDASGNKVDDPATLAFSSLGVPDSKATNKVVCPLVYNPSDPATSFASGIRVANVATSGSVKPTITLVKKDGGTSVSLSLPSPKDEVLAGEGQTNYLPELEAAGAPKALEGAAFIEAPAGSTIIAVSNALNGGKPGSGATQAGVMYDCVNY